MTTITATEFKTNFKHFGKIVTSGEHLLIKRPQKEPNLVIINENEYKEMNRLLAYYKGIFETQETTTPTTTTKRDIIGFAKGKIFYPDDFDKFDEEIMNAFYNDEDAIL